MNTMITWTRMQESQSEKWWLNANELGVSPRSEVLRTASTIVETITDMATGEKIDLIVMGTRGLGGFKKLLMGSVSSGVVLHAPCNVLVIK